ncbi:MAG: 16S rRNA processing protein RimM [Desulfobacterales bacterium]|nr:16S rRNA processing protein RimM [Desulfobacterales bacterium]
MGKIVGVHGIKGIIKILSHADSFSFFCPGRYIFLKSQKGDFSTYKIEWSKPHKKIVLASFKGIDTCEKAAEFIGTEIFIDKNELPYLEEGVYYWFEIIGLSVYSVLNEYIGIIESIIPAGSNDVYVVKNKEKEILLPAIESVIKDINISKKTMIVDIPEGL